jgi:hypothetical protein
MERWSMLERGSTWAMHGKLRSLTWLGSRILALLNTVGKRLYLRGVFH